VAVVKTVESSMPKSDMTPFRVEIDGVEHRLISSKQRNVVETQNARNEPGRSSATRLPVRGVPNRRHEGFWAMAGPVNPVDQ
jgi:hypothetical protein